MAIDLPPVLAEQFGLALVETGLSRDEVLLLALAGRSVEGGAKAASYPAGEILREEADDIICGPALLEANSAEAINKQRLAIFTEFDQTDPLEVAIGGALLRHAEQRLSAAGTALFALDELAEDLLSWKAGGLAGSRVLYNLKPTESDANDAAALFLRNHHPLQVEAILEGKDAPLARSLTPPAPIDGLLAKTVAFMFLYREVAEDPVRSRDLAFEDRIRQCSDLAAAHWRSLAWGPR